MRMQHMVMILMLVGCGDKQPTGQAENPSDDTHEPVGTDTSLPPDTDSGTDSGDGVPPPVTGCASGINPVPLGGSTCYRQAACKWTGDQTYGNLGYDIDLGGDINGDGWTDLVVGAPTEDVIVDDVIVRADAGRVHLWLNVGLEDETAASGIVAGAQAGAYLGYSVAIAPDVNGDGLDDVIMGGRGNTIDGVLAGGTAALLLGRAEGLDSPDLEADFSWSGVAAYDRTGSTVAGAGDLDGDGLGELLIATEQRKVSDSGYESPAAGRVVIVSGRADFSDLSTLADASASVVGSGITDGTGVSMTTGDLDGDGHLDLIVGAPYGDGNKGRVTIYRGGPETMSGEYTPEMADMELIGSSYGAGFGYTLAAGDLDADGKAELVVGAPIDDLTYPDAGSVSVYGGDITLFEGRPMPHTRLHGEFDDHQLGMGLQAGPDLNGDGVGDLVMGAIQSWQGLVTKGGRVYLLSGPYTDWPEVAAASVTSAQVFGAETKDYLGRANAAADINGDGKAELVVSTAYSNLPTAFDSGSIGLFWGE